MYIFWFLIGCIFSGFSIEEELLCIVPDTEL